MLCYLLRASQTKAIGSKSHTHKTVWDRGTPVALGFYSLQGQKTVEQERGEITFLINRGDSKNVLPYVIEGIVALFSTVQGCNIIFFVSNISLLHYFSASLILLVYGDIYPIVLYSLYWYDTILCKLITQLSLLILLFWKHCLFLELKPNSENNNSLVFNARGCSRMKIDHTIG